jgi:hypothetical protein
MNNKSKVDAQSPKNNSNTGISSEKLNLIIAVCAIFISAASFYATYLQADAAERQVKAMTLPLIQFSSGNWDGEARKQTITLTLNNAGVGPAIIKRVDYKYQGKSYASLYAFYQACCKAETKAFFQTLRQNKKNNTIDPESLYLTSPLLNSMIPGQEKIEFIKVLRSESNQDFWQKLDSARFDLTLKVCYCSLLGECYNTEKNGIVEPIDQCPIRLENIE